MEKERIDSLALNRAIAEHKKAMRGDVSCKKIEQGFLHKKRVSNIIFESVEGLNGHPFQESEFSNCVFVDVDLYYANFSGSTFSNCIFVNCSFVKSDMLNVKLFNCVFNNCKLFRTILDGQIEQTIFKDCDLKNMILTESQISNTVFAGETEPPNTKDNKEENVLWNLTNTSL